MAQQQQQLHPELQPIVAELNKATEAGNALADKKQKYLTQYNENVAVQKEFDHMNEDAGIYKKIGVVLVKQDSEEAKGNVEQRLTMIQNQIKEVTEAMKKNEKEQHDIQMRVMRKQKEIQEKMAKEAREAAKQEN